MIPFHVPSELVDSFVEGKVLLFVGAGVSTEAPKLLHNTLYEHISYLIGNKDLTRPFPDVMEEYCKGPERKSALVQQIRDRIDYIYSHLDLYQDATRFHQELSTFFPIDTIATTNWDTYFEDECGATAFVEDKDIALWNVAKRKVLKIHGTIASFGSIVATRTDYDKCGRRLQTGILGAQLKSLLATRYAVFIGYSLRDDDFLQVFNATRKHLADFHRESYFISPKVSDDDHKRLKHLNLTLIQTDGTFFIAQLKKHAQSIKSINTDDVYDDVDLLLSKVVDAHLWLHDTFRVRSYPQIMICSWYQDGLIDALRRILRLRRTGEYSDLHRVFTTAKTYYVAAGYYRRDNFISDAAYCEGYAAGMLFAFQKSPRLEPPIFFHFGDFTTSGKSIYKRFVSRLPALHKRAHNYALNVISKAPPHEDIVMHHRAQLNLGRYFDDEGRLRKTAKKRKR